MEKDVVSPDTSRCCFSLTKSPHDEDEAKLFGGNSREILPVCSESQVIQPT